MTDVESHLENAFETTLTAQMDPTDLVAFVDSISGLTSPCYLVIDPSDDELREFIYFDGVFGASSFVTTSDTQPQRYLPGSAKASNITHLSGAIVASIATAQQFENLYDRIDDNDALLAGLETNKLEITGTAADSELLDTHDSTYFGTAAAVAAAQADADAAQADADAAQLEITDHKGQVDIDDHPEATSSTRGFMSANDKDKLDATGRLSDTLPAVLRPDQAASAGVATTAPRRDHSHSTPAATAVQQTVETGSSEGSSSSFARADHVHNLPAASGVSIGSTNTEGSSASFARADHTHDLIANSVKHGDMQMVAKYGERATEINIGTGIEICSTGSLVLPSAGLLIFNWQVLVELTAATHGLTDTITIIPRVDGANYTSRMYASDLSIGRVVTDDGDRVLYAGNAYIYRSGADTSTYTLHVSKVSGVTYSVITASLTVVGIPL